jgi:hypothetical protein
MGATPPREKGDGEEEKVVDCANKKKVERMKEE